MTLSLRPSRDDRAALLGDLKILALFGPTGVGKTTVAVAVADRLREAGEDPVAVSADALQVYRGLETLTGAPSGAERARLEHRLVGVLSVSSTFSAGEYAARAHEEIDAALAAGRRPIVVGGTGLYLQAAVCDLELRPPPPEGLREGIEARLAERGTEALHAELAERSPDAAAAVATTDRTRLVRTLELLEMGKEPALAGDRSRLWTAELRHPTLLCGLTMEREELYARIDSRVEWMVAAGAGDEISQADAAGASHTARAALGFEELLRGDVEGMKQNTRRLAKRQLTWLRKLRGAHVLDTTHQTPEQVAAEVLALA
ncbi:MAG: tRNA (adenosine(37)-N6)-dimethylallyltransferase MiaA [Actinomycetota bacterium]|nr:tRNA (adenosine(37)-N6)-dimethylallyltransferase MiaA [Actinomycetota bacterium]